MTVYYVNPLSGIDTRTGLSWALAWKSLRGLRTKSVVLVAGDEVRIAQSPEYTPSIPFSESGDEHQALTWYIREEKVLETWTTYGVNTFRELYSTQNESRGHVSFLNLQSGTMAVIAPVVAHLSVPVKALATAGALNTANTLLFGALTNRNAWDNEGRSRVGGQIRFYLPYAGTGDQDLPAGALSIVFKNAGGVVREVPLPMAIRNSADWTPFEIDFTAFATGTTLTEVWLARTGVAITRGTTDVGIELSNLVLSIPTALRTADTVFLFDRTNFLGGAGEQVAATNDIRVAAEALDYLDTSNGANVFLSVGWEGNSRVELDPTSYVRAHIVEETPFVGSGGTSPSGALGVFDLNGSLGGTAVNPVKITGGWDTATSTVTGLTAFSAGLSQKLPSAYALFDLTGTNHIQIENISAVYGFKSFFTRAKSVKLVKCSLPFSLSPAFGQVTVDTHVSLDSMYIAPMLLEGWGVMGDLTLSNVFYASAFSPVTDGRCEAKTLRMTNSHMGRIFSAPHLDKPYYLRGDATLDGCSLVFPPKLVSIQFGNTLTFKNHKPFLTAQRVRLIPTAPESRWNHILYEDTAMPTYSFNTPSTFYPEPTENTCDAKVSINTFDIMQPSKAEALHYPTALRGSHITGDYTDGVSLFGMSQLTATRGVTRETMTAHFAHRSLTRPAIKPSALTGYGDVSVPPWAYTATQAAPTTTLVSQDPDMKPTGRLWLTRRFENITYRTQDTVFLCTMLSSTLGLSWITAKALFLPKAGNYRAHFGFMGENLNWDNYNQDVRLVQPMRVRTDYPSAADGRLLGRVAVFGEALPGPALQRLYYAATPEELATGEGNREQNQWRDIFIDFTAAKGGLIELRIGSSDLGTFNMAIFDTLNIYEIP